MTVKRLKRHANGMARIVAAPLTLSVNVCVNEVAGQRLPNSQRIWNGLNPEPFYFNYAPHLRVTMDTFFNQNKTCLTLGLLTLALMTLNFEQPLLLGVFYYCHLNRTPCRRPRTGKRFVPKTRESRKRFANSKAIKAQYQFFGLGETKKKLDDLLDSMNKTSDKTHDIAEQIFSVMNPSDTFLDTKVSKGLISLLRIVVNCSMAKDDLKVWNFVFNVSTEFGPSVVKRLVPLFAKPNQADYQFSMADLSSDNLKAFFGEHASMTKAALAAALAILLQVALGVPNVSSADAVLKHFGDRSRNLNNIVSFGKNSSDLFQSAADYVLNSILPGYASTEMDDYVSGYDKWAKDVLSLGDVTNPVETRIQKDKKLVYQIDRLYKQGIEYASVIKSLRVKPNLIEHYQRVFKIIEEYRKKCDYTGVFGNRPRVKPLVVYLFGESGVGKSGMTWPLACDLNALFAADIDQAKDFASEIYFRNVEQEFWDGYHGQSLVIYDDFGQRTDAGTSPNEEFMEVIRTANIAPYPLHMAQLDEKKRTKFVSKAIILTSNILNQKVSSLTFPDAVFRRVDICGEVKVKDEYSKQCWSASSGMMVSRLDRSKCAGPVDTNPYEIVLYDPESKQPITDSKGEQIVVSYEDFLSRCIDVAERSFEDSMNFNTILDKRIDEARFNKIKGNRNIPVIELPAEEEEKLEPGVQALYDLGVSDSRLTSLFNTSSIKSKFQYNNLEIPERRTMWNSVTQILNTVKSGASSCLDTLRTKTTELKERFFYEKEMVFTMDPDSEIFYDHRFKITTAEIKQALREKLDEFSKLKNLLFVLGLIILGFGAFKLLGGSKKHQRYPDSIGDSENPSDIMLKAKKALSHELTLEANSSGDSLTRTAKRVGVEALSSGDSNTPRAPRIGVEAFTSGDSQSIRSKRIGVEASVSGDPKTVRAKRINVEAASSGDTTTRFANRIKCEAFTSGDSNTPKARKIQTEFFNEPIPSEMQAWSDKTAGDLISHRILSNMYKIRSDNTNLVNGLFIRDTVMLTPRHVLPYIKDTITITNAFGAQFTVPTNTIRAIGLTDSAGNDKDAVLLQFPRHIHAHSDLVKHFQKMPELSLRAADVCLPTLRVLANKFCFAILGNVHAAFTRLTLEIKGVEVHIRDAITYRLNTINGDCGSPVIVNETSVLRKIAGIHIAAALSGQEAYGQSVTQDDLIKHLALLPNQPLITDLDDLPNFIVKPSDFQMNTEYSKEDVVKMTNLPADTFGFAGTCSNVPYLPNETDIRPSVIHGYTHTLTKPAYLKHKELNLLHKNVEKCAINTPYIPSEEVDRAVKEVESKLLSGDSRSRLARVLTFEEAISGNDDSQFISGINRRTSPGYPWILKKEYGKVGKTQWLGEDDYVYDDEVRAVVNNRIESARKGIRVPTVWTDTLKDERRPIEKVNAFKTRVFSHGPFDYTIAFRMYFLGFIAHIMENRIENEQSIGTNVYNADWKKTFRKLQRKGKRVFAGDFSTFDGTLNSCIMSEFAKVANKFYNDGPENARIREVLMLDVFNSIHLCQNVYYSCTHSQPSGNPLTTVLNSFYNSVSMRIAFYRVVGNRFRFEDEVSMVSYGDDNVVNITDRVSEVFNQNSCTEAYASFGMIYTDEAKTSSGTPDYRMISEVAYLKRGFRVDDYGYVRAPVSLDTITETPQWIRQTPEFVEQCKENVENQVRELAQHPEAIFDKYSEEMIQAFYAATSVYPEVGTYKYYEAIFNDEYYC